LSPSRYLQPFPR